MIVKFIMIMVSIDSVRFGLLNRCDPLRNMEIKRAVVKTALPAFDGLAVRLLANVTHIALDGSTSSSL
jgi:hypothetical protein